MNIYQVSGDPDFISIAFRSVDEVLPLGDVEHDNARLAPDHVVHIGYRFSEPESEGVVTDAPDSRVGGTLLLSGRAQDALAQYLHGAGALVRLEPAHDMGYRMIVCYRAIDALDPGRTIHEPGADYSITQFAFYPAPLEGVDLVRLSNRVGRLFVSERFVETVRQHRLTGFRFRHVWSIDLGGIPIEDPIHIFRRFEPGWGSTLREKRQRMRAFIASTAATGG